MHHTTLALIAAGIPLVLTTATVSAAELHVPADFVTIQAAIDAAVPADHVVLADGVYAGPGNVGLDFDGKDITVRSANGAAACVIDGSGSPGANAFVFDSDESSLSRVEGLTFENFATVKGGEGAIRITSASPRIEDCVFRSCSTAPAPLATSPGSAIHMTTATPLVQRCRFEGNEGSAVLVGEGTVVYLIDCTFEDNTARSDDGIGGGAVQNRGFVLIFTSLLRGNAVEAVAGPARGGAVAHVGLALDLTTNTFEANRVSGPQATEGAAVYAAGDFVLNAGTFRDHTGDHAGAVVMIDGSTLAAPIAPFVDGLFEMNTVGGLRLVDPLDLVEARLSSSTFCRNTPFDVIGSFVDFGANRVCCPGDIDGNGDTGFGDLSSLLTAWGPCDGCAADLDLSGAVGFPDLAALLAAWGDCPQLDFGG